MGQDGFVYSRASVLRLLDDLLDRRDGDGWSEFCAVRSGWITCRRCWPSEPPSPGCEPFCQCLLLLFDYRFETQSGRVSRRTQLIGLGSVNDREVVACSSSQAQRLPRPGLPAYRALRVAVPGHAASRMPCPWPGPGWPT
jgi:hypothetical protein